MAYKAQHTGACGASYGRDPARASWVFRTVYVRGQNHHWESRCI